jgi:hypothetical protein
MSDPAATVRSRARPKGSNHRRRPKYPTPGIHPEAFRPILNHTDEKEADVRVVRVGGDGELGLPDPGLLEPVEQYEPEPPESAEPDFPLVLVSWHDAWFDFEAADPDDCRTDYVVRTVGFLVSQGPRFLSIAQEVLPDGDGFRAVTHIPISIVEEVTTLAAEPDAGLPAFG